MQTEPRIRVEYYRVHDPSYPRNRLIRHHLGTRPDIDVTVTPASSHCNRVVRAVHDLVSLLRASRRSDVVVLSEMRLQHAVPAAFVCRMTGSLLVVDGFIGLHETTVDDWGETRTGSPRARILDVLDRLAVRVADIYLTDTEFRAQAVRRRHADAVVVSVPVGAPAWAVPQAPVANDVLEILYYGNYIPLHGLDVVIDALALLLTMRPFHVTLIGNGPLRPAYEQRVKTAGLLHLSTFVDPIDESELVEHIAAADVVLGVFGSSSKARGVIANKVWQGLACGRTTITRQSPALDEIRAVAGALLITTEPGSPASLAAVLQDLSPQGVAAPRDIGERLAELVDSGLTTLEMRLRRAVRHRRRRRR